MLRVHIALCNVTLLVFKYFHTFVYRHSVNSDMEKNKDHSHEADPSPETDNSQDEKPDHIQGMTPDHSQKEKPDYSHSQEEKPDYSQNKTPDHSEVDIPKAFHSQDYQKDTIKDEQSQEELDKKLESSGLCLVNRNCVPPWLSTPFLKISYHRSQTTYPF